MATYEEIYGKRVDVLDADPTLTSANEGQVWYNSTTGTLKTVSQASAWISGPTMVTTRRAINNGFGTQTAGVTVGGYDPGYFNVTEEYNGSGWAAGGTYPASLYYITSAGTSTAGVAVGGGDPVSAVVGEYDGSSWTAVTSLPTATKGMMRAGTQTAALFGGGFQPATTGVSYEYDGTNWTAGGTLNTARGFGAGSGSQTDALFFGGGSTTTHTETEEYNGTSWSGQNGLPTAKQNIGCANDATSSLALGSGGYTPPNTRTTTCYTYDGSSWASIPSLSTARSQMASGAGTVDGTYVAGGTTSGTAINTTEEYNKSINTITAGAFSSQTGPTSPVYGAGTGGTPTAAFLVAGFGCGPNPSAHKITNQHYDGSSWSEAADINSGRFLVGASGTQTASLVFGGRAYPSPPTNDLTEEFDGSSWTVGNVLNTARQFGASCGTQTAGLGTGGSATQANEEYDGSTWTSVTNYPLSTDAQLRTTGIQTAAITSGGPPSSTATNTYDGTNWTAAPDMVAVVQEGNLNGTTSSAIHAGGSFGGAPYAAQSQIFDSTTWATGANMGTGRNSMPSGPSSTTSISGSLIFGGPLGAPTYNANQLEEYTGETSAINAKTLTTG